MTRFRLGLRWLRWRLVRETVRDKALDRRVLSRQGTHPQLRSSRGAPLPRHPPDERVALRVLTDPATAQAGMSARRRLRGELLKRPASILLRLVEAAPAPRSPKRT